MNNTTTYAGGEFTAINAPEQIDLSGVTNQALISVEMLKDELQRYKEQAEKIPRICDYYNFIVKRKCGSEECPTICSKYEGGESK